MMHEFPPGIPDLSYHLPVCSLYFRGLYSVCTDGYGQADSISLVIPVNPFAVSISSK